MPLAVAMVRPDEARTTPSAKNIDLPPPVRRASAIKYRSSEWQLQEIVLSAIMSTQETMGLVLDEKLPVIASATSSIDVYKPP